MEEPRLVAMVATKIIGQHGSKSLATINEHCQMAYAIGDWSSLQTWRNIAVAVQRLQEFHSGANLDADAMQPSAELQSGMAQPSNAHVGSRSEWHRTVIDPVSTE